VFAILVLEEEELPHESAILTTSFVTIGLSVLAHGVTAAPLAARYADWHDARVAETPVESGEEEELPWRLQAR
jgi:NhaP-type Na+/H+ or K+/H+ antiporter